MVTLYFALGHRVEGGATDMLQLLLRQKGLQLAGEITRPVLATAHIRANLSRTAGLQTLTAT